MPTPTQIDKFVAEAEALAAKVDVKTVLAIAASAVQALPAIEQGIASAIPYISALRTVLAGGTPTDDDWAALDAALDAGTAALQEAAAETGPET